LTDEVAVQKFFMTEISLGEQLLGVGDIQNGIEHLANAVAVTSHKENLLNVLRTTLPDPIFSLLVQKLPEVSRVNILIEI
jgi:import receptor subunit TOM20